MSETKSHNTDQPTIVYGSGRKPDAAIPRPGVKLRKGKVGIVVKRVEHVHAGLPPHRHGRWTRHLIPRSGFEGAPTVLLLHGFPTSSHMFRNLIPALADRYHVVAPDYPGYGNSSAPPIDEFEYTFDNLATVVEKFTETVGLKKYSIYLMDYGAPVGFRLAVKHPERVDTLIVQNGNAYDEGLDNDSWKPIKAYWKSRTKTQGDQLRSLLTLDATKWQYTHGFADFGGNRQYITLGNLAENPKAFIFLMDYVNSRRIKLWGTARVVEDDSELLGRLRDPDYPGKVERAILFEIESWDVNCPQHIHKRFPQKMVAPVIEELQSKVEELQARLAEYEESEKSTKMLVSTNK